MRLWCSPVVHSDGSFAAFDCKLMSLWLMGRVEGRSFGGWGPSAELGHRFRQVLLSWGPPALEEPAPISAAIASPRIARRVARAHARALALVDPFVPCRAMGALVDHAVGGAYCRRLRGQSADKL